MKKLLIIFAAAALFQTVAYARSVDSLSGIVTENREYEITDIENGYYDLTVKCVNSAVDVDAYVYGYSDDYTISGTVIPKTDDEQVVVTVKGIGTLNGKLVVGVKTSGKSKIVLSDAKLTKSKENYFITGGDMTEVNYIESLGGEYKDADGNKVDPFDFLAQNGVNMARIRLSNTTGKGTGDGVYYLPEGFQDEHDCLKLAGRAKKAGMGIQFTFNYSDYWSNGSRQIIPSEWVKQIKDELGYDIKDASFLNSMTDAQRTEIKDTLAEIVYEYTFDVMTKLKNQGTVPEYVSLGNEIRGGMLFPFCNTYDANMNRDRFELVFGDDKDEKKDIKCPADWDGLVQIINAGYDAVKAVSPESRVVIHLDDGSKINKFDYFFDELEKRGAKYDVIGASYYPAWTGNSVQSCVDFCNEISQKYDKDILIMETGFNWNDTKKNGYGGQLIDADVYKDKYPPTPEGHAGFIAELTNGLKSVEDGRCLGFLYWDPCMIHVEDVKNPNESLSGWAIRESDDRADANVVENTTLFDFDGKAIPTIEIFKNSQNSRSENDVHYGISVKDENNTVTAEMNNNTGFAKNISVIIVMYDDNGNMTGTVNKSVNIAAYSKETLSAQYGVSARHTVYLWNGNELSNLTN